MFVIYCHTHTSSGRKYVGQTRRTAEQRWRNHVSLARRKPGTSAFLRAIAKYGPDAFSMSILVAVESLVEANAAERFWIAKLNTLTPNGFNLDGGGDSKDVHPETRKIISLASKAAHAAKTPEVRRAIALRRMAALSFETKSEASKRGRQTMGPERRSEAQRLAHARRTREQESERGRRIAAAQTPEARSERQRKTMAAKTPEERSAIARKINAAQTPQHRSDRMRKAAASMTPEARTARAHKVWSYHTAEERSAIAKKRTEELGADKRSERVRKAWTTRRAKKDVR